ncbi:alkaline phosphatase family protein, partial [Bifidobacterium pseudocatenulatum]|nr:alkaline phosphatase family protein [Bifidobacterium pseudocatenulatum]
TCMPSTTVAAISTLGTGKCPGMTCMTGYTKLNPKTDEICQLISFKNSIPPLELQQQPTIIERLSAQHDRVTSSGLPK